MYIHTELTENSFIPRVSNLFFPTIFMWLILRLAAEAVVTNIKVSLRSRSIDQKSKNITIAIRTDLAHRHSHCQTQLLTLDLLCLYIY